MQMLQNITAAMNKLHKAVIPLKLNVLKSMQTTIQSCHSDMSPGPGAQPENLDDRTLRTTANHCATEIMKSHYQWTIKTLEDILQHSVNDPKHAGQSFSCNSAQPHFNQMTL